MNTVSEDSVSMQEISAQKGRILQEIVVTSKRKDENITGIVMGVEKLNIKEIKLMPALMGEVDIIKAIQLLPGIQAAS